MTPRLALVLVLVVASSASAQGPTPTSLPTTAQRLATGKILFTSICANCHGVDGRGEGLLKTVPAPRDLTAGRFSFGTTKDAILRTVENGIPPAMPPHKALLEPAQCQAVVEYVLSIMPEQIEMPPRLSRLEIRDRALFVSGSVAGLPRALVVGLPPGFTVVLDANDLRIVEIRRGEFVDRTDWRGRGGTPLELLGKPWPGFANASKAEKRGAIRRELCAYEARGAVARIEYVELEQQKARGAANAVLTLRSFTRDGVEGVVVRHETDGTGPFFEAEVVDPGQDATVFTVGRRIDARTFAVAHALCRQWSTATAELVKAEVGK